MWLLLIGASAFPAPCQLDILAHRATTRNASNPPGLRSSRERFRVQSVKKTAQDLWILLDPTMFLWETGVCSRASACPTTMRLPELREFVNQLSDLDTALQSVRYSPLVPTNIQQPCRPVEQKYSRKWDERETEGDIWSLA